MGKKLMNRVREYRQQRGLSQEDVAKLVGVSRQTMIAIEKGDYVPSVALAMNLAKQFQTNIEKLFYWT